MKILTSNVRPDVKIYEVLIFLTIMFVYGYLGGRMMAEKECLEQKTDVCQCEVKNNV